MIGFAEQFGAHLGEYDLDIFVCGVLNDAPEHLNGIGAAQAFTDKVDKRRASRPNSALNWGFVADGREGLLHPRSGGFGNVVSSVEDL